MEPLALSVLFTSCPLACCANMPTTVPTAALARKRNHRKQVQRREASIAAQADDEVVANHFETSSGDFILGKVSWLIDFCVSCTCSSLQDGREQDEPRALSPTFELKAGWLQLKRSLKFLACTRG